jgi:hypothetical protein
MKRAIALAALLLAASACATTENTNTTNANANANATPAATATPAAVSQADIEAKERQAWDAIKSKSWDAFAAMLSDDFVNVSRDGLSNKADTVTGIKTLDMTEYTFSDFKFLKVDADLALITYTVSEKSTYEGKPTSGKPTRSSTAWINRGGKWLIAYHQETEIKEMPASQPTPGAAASPASSPAASPTASPSASPAAAATATDMEKQVWEAIKSKNYDAFASFLAPDALEVNEFGVFDKAGSTKGVMQFDASKFTQSEFKEIKLDADATLLTYTVTGPMNGKTITEHHTSIWANRGGQWKAAFHQGTPHEAPPK